MLIESDPSSYRKYFHSDPNPFISEKFIELNCQKAERIVRLVNADEKPAIGLLAGIKNGFLLSPFSAPSGGFHFRNEKTYIGEIDNFLSLLKDYIVSKSLKGIEITLPPDIYSPQFNAKAINSFARNGFRSEIPEITGWVNLESFNNVFTQSNSREYYRQSLRNGLVFELALEESDRREVFNLIRENRAKFGRPIFMSYDDIVATGDLWPVDYFKVMTTDKTIVASAIMYQNHPEIVYAVFWGDNENGRPLRAMDFLAFNLWSYYKNLGYKYIDLGISTETGNPNEGLLRFKESHESVSSLRYKFYWKVD